MSVLFCDDAEIKKLNTQYRKKTKATDVLSFSHIEGLQIHLWEVSLGELVISVDTLKVQAKEFHVTVKEELVRLLTHGMLHLLGFDHEKVSTAEAAKMRRHEKRLMAILKTSRFF